MKIIGGKRACGKTTWLIEQSAKEWLYIVCASEERAHNIFQMAKDDELDIPFPNTVRELPLKNMRIEKVLVDDIEDVLKELIGKEIGTMTTSYVMEELHGVNVMKIGDRVRMIQTGILGTITDTSVHGVFVDWDGCNSTCIAHRLIEVIEGCEMEDLENERD